MNSLLLRALLASLPVLGLALDPQSGLLCGTSVLLALLLATLIFLTLHPLLPRVLHRLSFFLLLWVLGVVGIEFFSIPPLLLVSLTLLPLPDLFREPKKRKRIWEKTLFTGLYFWAFLVGHALVTGLLGRGMGIPLFHEPAGSYFLLGLAVTFLGKR